MSSHDEQVQQRHSNLAALGNLGIEIYPRTFERRHAVSELVDQHGQRTHDELEADRVETITSGRILAIRADSKVLIMTAANRPDRVAGSLRGQAAGYLSKPFSKDQLKDALTDARSSRMALARQL